MLSVTVSDLDHKQITCGIAGYFGKVITLSFMPVLFLDYKIQLQVGALFTLRSDFVNGDTVNSVNECKRSERITDLMLTICFQILK